MRTAAIEATDPEPAVVGTQARGGGGRITRKNPSMARQLSQGLTARAPMALAQSITERAIQGCAPEADEAALPKLASAARYKVSKAARQTCQESIQMHGGMGMMEEVTVGHHLKRVTVMNSMLGDARWHLRRYATLASPDG